MTQPTAEELYEKIVLMSPADQLRAAAELLEGKLPRLALAVAARVVNELEILRIRGQL